MAYRMHGIPIPDWSEIKGYFTQVDIEHMKAATDGQLDLSDCSSVAKFAPQIYQQVSSGSMPPGNPWPPAKINGFFAWWKNGAKCPP